MNSLGDAETRAAYTTALRSYLQTHSSDLSPTSQQRLLRGSVLRVLDSKEPADRAIVAQAPRIDQYLSAAAAARYSAVQRDLAAAGVAFEHAPLLVRGLDYYQ